MNTSKKVKSDIYQLWSRHLRILRNLYQEVVDLAGDYELAVDTLQFKKKPNEDAVESTLLIRHYMEYDKEKWERDSNILLSEYSGYLYRIWLELREVFKEAVDKVEVNFDNGPVGLKIYFQSGSRTFDFSDELTETKDDFPKNHRELLLKVKQTMDLLTEGSVLELFTRYAGPGTDKNRKYREIARRCGRNFDKLIKDLKEKRNR